MSTASKLGAAFGAGLLGFMLLGSPAMAGPDDHDNNGKGSETSAERASANDDVTKKNNGSEAALTDAAPGGADREVESGGSGTQGMSESNPDDEGVDKPYAAAGQVRESQGESDYDGNNGCGNDTDFADDNNGNCGGKKATTTPDTPINGGRGGGGGGGGGILGNVVTESAQVMGIQIERAATASTTAAAPAGAQVLGLQIERAAPSALARTGLPLGFMALLGFGFIGGGIAARRAARM